MRRRISVYIAMMMSCVVCLCGYVHAENISISAEVDKNVVTLDDTIMFQVSVSGDINNIPPPQLPDMRVFTIHSAGKAYNMSVVDGNASATLVYNYALSPRTTGKHTIGSVVLTYKGATYRTNPIEVEVVSQGSPTGRPVQQAVAVSDIPETAQSKNIFITTSVDKKHVYVNEPMTLTFRLFSRVNFLSQPEYTPPSTTGFWAEDLPPQRVYTATHGGRNYRVVEIKTALFPTAPGAYTITPAQIRCAVQKAVDPFGDDFFGGFFSGGETVTLQSDPIAVNVKPLPDGRPASFRGSVGTFRMDVHADRKEAEVGDAVTLVVTIRGEGNIKSVGDPVFVNAPQWKQYDMVTSFAISKNGYKVSGSKTFKIVFVPKVSGTFALPDVTFSFFDPTTKMYKTLTSSSGVIRVAPSSKKIAHGVQGVTPLSSSGDVTVITNDIRFIKPTTHLCDASPFVMRRGWFIVLFVGAPFVYGVGLLIRLRRAHEKYHQKTHRSKKALKYAFKKIAEAKKSISSNEKQAAHLLFTALTEYLARKLYCAPSGLTLKDVQEKLCAYTVDDALQQRIKRIWDDLDCMRFAPSMITREGLTTLAAELGETLEMCEMQLEGKL